MLRLRAERSVLFLFLHDVSVRLPFLDKSSSKQHPERKGSGNQCRAIESKRLPLSPVAVPVCSRNNVRQGEAEKGRTRETNTHDHFLL